MMVIVKRATALNKLIVGIFLLVIVLLAGIKVSPNYFHLNLKLHKCHSNEKNKEW